MPGGNVKGRPNGSISQMAECSNGQREALGSSRPGHDFSSPVTLGFAIRRLEKLSLSTQQLMGTFFESGKDAFVCSEFLDPFRSKGHAVSNENVSVTDLHIFSLYVLNFF